MGKEENLKKTFMLPDMEKPPRFLAGIDPYKTGEKNLPKVAIVGDGNTGKTGLMYNPFLLDEVMQFPLTMEQTEEDYQKKIKDLLKYYNSTGNILTESSHFIKRIYKVVFDEAELLKFIETLPDLEGDDKFYYCLFARKKYNATEGLKSDKNQLKRGTTTKDRMLRDFKRMEVALGLYEIDGIPINQESLVLYISPNPTDVVKAAGETALAITDRVLKGKTIGNPSATALNFMQTCVKKKYFNIDIDFTENGLKYSREEVKDFILDENYLNEEAMTFIATRGGFHILVNYSKIDASYSSSWYKNFSEFNNKIFTTDMNNGNGFTPVPGCVQSNYVPKLI